MSTLRWGLWAAVGAAVGLAAWSHRGAVVEALRFLPQAYLPWLVLAMASVAVLYACRAVVYGVPLRLLDYTVPWTFLWQTAIIASAVNQLLPTGGASSYAFLAYALHRRGVTTGQASLVALIDTLSYAFAAATIVLGALAYLGAAGGLPGRVVLLAFVPGTVLVGVAGWLYWLQRDRQRFVPMVLRLQRRLGSLLRRELPETPARSFLEDYYKGKEVIAGRPAAFVWMIALQYLAVCADAATLYLALLSLGLLLSPATVFLGFVVTLAAGTVVSAPAGGGSFEVVMSAFFARQGVDTSRAIAGALLFRLVSFWLPVLVSGVLVLTFRRHTTEIRRRHAIPRRRPVPGKPSTS